MVSWFSVTRVRLLLGPGLLRPPAVSTATLVGRTLALDYLLLGLTALVSTFFPANSEHRSTGVIRVLAVLAVLGSPVFLRLRRTDWWLLNSITLSGTATITIGVRFCGGGTTAVVSSMLYLLVIVHVFYAYARAVAWLHVCVAAAMAVLVLHNDTSVGASELIVLLGVVLAISILVGWLVRAADLAEIDFLTGLANRRGLESAAQAMLQSRPGEREIALVMIDLDGFRAVNERHGHAGGDDLLLSLARTWRQLLPRGALLTRHGGDEFVVLLADPSDSDLAALLSRMREGAETTAFSAGVARAAAGESLSMLLSRADSALYEAKRCGGAQTAFSLGPGDNQNGQDILSGLAAGQFAVFYQPIIDLNTGVVKKAEALIRWMHPETGMIPPDDFIRRAEVSGVITVLGEWVLTQACRDAASWELNCDGEPVGVSVNVSGLELQDSDYASRLRQILADSQLPPERLVIELVETDYNVHAPVVTDNLAAIAASGVKLAIDDFGTGYSSMNRLHQLQVHQLKIDRSFVSGITDRAQSVPVVTAILAMARALDLEVVAEGIESPEQAAWLRRHGCGYAQGYLYGRPQPGPPVLSALHIVGEPGVTVGPGG